MGTHRGSGTVASSLRAFPFPWGSTAHPCARPTVSETRRGHEQIEAYLILLFPFRRVFICATVRPSGSDGGWNRTSSVFPSMFSVLLIEGVNAGGKTMPVSASFPLPFSVFPFPFFLGTGGTSAAGTGSRADSSGMAARTWLCVLFDSWLVPSNRELFSVDWVLVFWTMSLSLRMDKRCDGECKEMNHRSMPLWTPRSPEQWNMRQRLELRGYWIEDMPTGKMSDRRSENIANMSTTTALRGFCHNCTNVRHTGPQLEGVNA